MPVVVRFGAGGSLVALTEAALEDYAGMFVVGEAPAGTLRGTFPEVALAEAAQEGDERNTYPTKRPTT